MLTKCCEAGEKLADTSKGCTHLSAPLDKVPAALISGCFFSSQICCDTKLRIDQCKTGVEAAQEGVDCRESNHTDFYSNCCEACKIGIAIGTSNDCTVGNYMYGTPFDDSFFYCCNTMKTNDLFYLHEGDESIKRIQNIV